MRSPDEHARLKRYKYVAAPGSKFVCTGETAGSYNYALRDEVYHPDRMYIPTRNRWGGIDYIRNENYRKK